MTTTLNLDNVDLGGFGVTDEQSQATDLIEQQRQRKLNATVNEALKVDPDQQAHINQLSRDSSVPVDAVAADPSDIEHDLKLKNIDIKSLTTLNPATTRYLNNFDNASIAHDDIDSLVGLENVLKKPSHEEIKSNSEDENSFLGNSARGVGERVTELIGSLYGFAAQAGDAIEERFPMGGFVFEDSLIPRYAGPEEYKRLQDEGMENLVARTADILKETDFGYVPQATWETTKQAYSEEGVSLNAVGETLAFGFEQGTHSLADMVATVYALPTYIVARSQEIGESRAENKGLERATLEETIEAAPFAVGSAVLERILPSKVFNGMSKSEVDEVGKEILNQSANKLKQVMAAGGSGLIIESSTEAVQEGIIEYIGERYGTDTPLVLMEALDRAAGGAVGGGVAGGSLATVSESVSVAINTVAERRINAAADNASNQQILSDQEQRNIDKINEQSENSKLRERDNEAFKQFIEEADGDANTMLFIDGVQTKLYLADKQAQIETDSALQLLNEKANEAAALGGDLNIPVSEFAATLAGTDHFINLRDFMTLSETTQAPFRQEQSQVETQNYIQSLVQEAQQSTSQYVEAQDIFETVRAQLIDTGVVNPQNASVMAQIVPAWAAVQAERNGVSVSEVYENSGLTIEGPQTGEAARLSDQALSQNLNEESVDDFSTRITNQYGLEDFFLTKNSRGDVELANFVVPKSEQKQGLGTAAMNDLIQYADANGQRLILSPALKDDNKGTTSRARLVKFYKRFGFVENKGRNKSFEISAGMYREPQEVETFEQSEVDQTEEFKNWAGTDEAVIEPDEINDMDFTGEGPFVMRAYHGTTHDFEEFDASLRGNLEGQFGAVNYFTSSEYDADRNYTSGGPDLTIRIEQRAEQLANKLDDMAEETPDVAKRMVSELGLVVRDVNDHDLVAKAIAERELSGESEQVMELFIRTNKPFVVGTGDSPFIEFVDFEAIQEQAIEQVADNNGVEVSEVESNRDDYEDEIDEARWEIEVDTENDLFVAIDTVANRYGIDGAELYGAVSELVLEGTTSSELEQLLREQEQLTYAEHPETGALAGYHALAEIIQELGFDSIILKDANDRFSNMDMVEGTAHIHIFDANNTNIKSVNNQGTFDSADPNIFKQKQGVTRGYYDPANSVIRLTESADLSTFLHEFAHFMYEMELTTNNVNPDSVNTISSIHNWFKRNAEDVAKEAKTYQPKMNFEARHVEQYLDEGTTGSTERDSGIRRAVHEQFARGFEQYVMEGKAPSNELRNAFRTFARWLTQVYRAVRGDMRVNLDEEMREVFARLLATEEQINAAEARAQYQPMFTDAAMAGMTEEEFQKYQERTAKVKDVQTETLRDKLIKEFTRQTKSWWKEEKADLVDEQLETLRAEPVYSARESLKNGDIKLDHATVKEMIGEERTDKRGRKSTRVPESLRGMTVTGAKGVHPDQAAAFFGYGSGSELLSDLTDAVPIKVKAEANAEEQMLNKYGDMLHDGTIEAQADEAVQNEERGKLLLDELKALRKRSVSAPALDRATIKQMAEENIAKLSFRQIHPGKYRKAEIRAAQEASTALANGDMDQAARAKARQVLNYYLGMAATQARADTVKIVDRMARYNKKSVREEIQKAENGYWEQIVKILNRFEFRKAISLKAVDQQNQDINTWAKERIETDGDALVLSPAVMNESFVTHWKNVPYADLQGVNDSVKNIEHVARYSNKMTRMGEEIEFKKLVQRWTDHIQGASKTRFKSQRTDVVEGRKWGRWAMAQMTKIPFMASWLDGGERAGMSHDILVQPFTDAYDAEINLWKDVGEVVMRAIEGRSKEDMKRHMRKVFIPELVDAENDGNLYGHQIIAVALNTGNESNLRKLLLGEGWANPDDETSILMSNPKLQAVLRNMTKADWDLVQLIWDQMELLYPQLSEVHRRTTGLVPPKIEATPVSTPFGEFRGGYYPIKYDPNRSQRAQENEDRLNAETESMFSNSSSIHASVTAGATNERTKYYAPIRLSLDVVPAHFQEAIHYITHHDPVREVNKLIRNPEVAVTIKEKLGPEEYAQLKPWLNDIAKDGREAPTKMFWDDMISRLRFGITLGTMGFKASTGIIQISGLSNTIAELGFAPVYKSMRSILGSPQNMKDAWDFASSNSKVLNHRMQTMDREIKNAMKRLEGKRGVLAAVQELSMKHIALIQTYMVDLPSWQAAYIKEMETSGDEQKAYARADWTIENIQGSGATKDLARIMRGQSETGRMLTMFMTFFSSLWNMERDLVKGTRSGRYSITSVGAKLAFLITIPVLFEMLMRGELGDEDDEPEEQLQKMLTKTALYPVASVPFVRDIASATTGEFGYNISPVASLIEQGTRSIPEVIERGFTDEEITKGQAKGATKFVGAAFGIPGTGQAWATGEHLYDVLERGEELTMQELLFGPKRD